jgi:hypothetical protein
VAADPVLEVLASHDARYEHQMVGVEDLLVAPDSL